MTAAATPVVMRLAHRWGWVAEPSADRWHERPTALMGGIAIYAGATGGLLLAPEAGEYWSAWAGGTILFAAGLADDLAGLSPVAKVLAQVAGATGLLLAGHELAPGWPLWLSVALTYFWVIGITNAVNLLDNMDGLAAGVAAIAAVTTAVLAGVAGAWSAGGAGLAVAGAAGAFLFFNFPPARIFMGDSGSLFLGFMVAAFALSHPGAGASGTAAVLAVPAAVMAVPILDTTLVTVRRIAAGRPVTQGGRDHSSHRLVLLGLSEREAVVTLYAIGGAFSVLAVAFRFFNVYLTLAVAALAVVALGVFGVFLGNVHVASSDRRERKDMDGSDQERVALRAVLRNKREIAGLVGDLLIVVASFVLAHYLRFETGLPAEHADRMVLLLPVVVLVKLGTLYGLGAYEGLRRYTGTHELVKAVVASTVASGLLVVGLVLVARFEGYSRSVFVIDWLLATGSLGALRGAFRGLRGYFASRGEGAKRVLLYGAGDAGYLALREIRQNANLDFEPVGFVDDDPAKQGRRVHGLEVLGDGHDLSVLCRRRDVTQVIVTISRLPQDVRQRIRHQCRELGIEYREMRVGFVESGAADVDIEEPVASRSG